MEVPLCNVCIVVVGVVVPVVMRDVVVVERGLGRGDAEAEAEAAEHLWCCCCCLRNS